MQRTTGYTEPSATQLKNFWRGLKDAHRVTTVTTMQDFHRMAAAMDQRVRQLEAEGLSGRQWIDRMVGHLPDLQQIWVGTDDRQLAELCHDYPSFYRYASLMEEAFQAARADPAAQHKDLPELPDDLKQPLCALLTTAATLERGYQTAIDAGQRAGDEVGLLAELNRLERQWRLDQKEFIETLNHNAASLPKTAQEFVASAIGDIADRVTRLKRRCLGV